MFHAGKIAQRRAASVLDFIMSLLLGAAFLLMAGALVAAGIFRKKRKVRPVGIVQMYLSIVDFRRSIISTQAEDLLVGGVVKKIFGYHFDFEADKSETASLGPDISLTNISVHPDCFFTRMGFRKTTAFFTATRYFFSMVRTCGEEGVDIIRAQDPHLLGMYAYILSRIFKIPFIVQICSNYEVKDRAAKGITFRPFLFKGIERAFERFIMRSSDLVLTDREHYRKYGLIPPDIHDDKYVNMGFFADAVHYAEPAGRKDLKKELGIPLDRKVLLYVGRFCPVKHPVDLVRMFSEALKKRKDIVLALAGDGESKGDMGALAESLGIADHVIFLDKLPQKKLVDLYNTADVVCFTSAGFTMIEAALAAKPIVAYDYEWHDEFMGDNERGILVPLGDYKRFAKEVIGLIGDDALVRKYGKAARAFALENYSKGSAAKKERDAYVRLLKGEGVI